MKPKGDVKIMKINGWRIKRAKALRNMALGNALIQADCPTLALSDAAWATSEPSCMIPYSNMFMTPCAPVEPIAVADTEAELEALVDVILDEDEEDEVVDNEVDQEVLQEVVLKYVDVDEGGVYVLVGV